MGAGRSGLRHWAVMLAALMVGIGVLPGALPAAAQQGPGDGTPAPYAGSLFKRVTLLVSDLDRSLAIYRDILGFQGGPIFESANTSYSYTVFNIDPKARIRGTMLSAGDAQVRTLAIFEITGQTVVVPQGPRPVAVVINARNLPDVMKRIEALGLQTFPTRSLKTPEGATGTEWAFVDPDGHLVVLYELDPR